MLKTSKNLKIKTTGQIIAVVLVLIAVGVLAVSVYAIRETRHMAVTWENYNTGPAQKTVALGKLRSALGYTGVIHEFKNYIIRQDRQRIVNIHIALQNVEIALTAYKSFGVNDAERAALTDLEETMSRYAAAVALAENMVFKGMSIVEIDKAVRVDDIPATQAMQVLDWELRAARELSSGKVYTDVTSVISIVTSEAIVVTSMISVVIVIFLWFTLWQLIRPISTLGKAMRELDLSSIQNMKGQLDIQGPYEIVELAASFNDMVDKLSIAATRERELQRELRGAQKLEAVGQLAGGIAHEINTPAQYIGDNIKFLSDAHKDMFTLIDKSLILTEAMRGQDGFSKMVEEIDAFREEIDIDYLQQEVPSATEQSLAGIGQVSQIVLAMKEFSHPGNKEKSLADINRALESTMTISRNEWKHVAEMTTSFDETLPAVSCLAGELNQVFLNLIVNAAHAIADKPGRSGLGQINISTQTDNKSVTIQVKDDGAGIPEDIQDHVFNPFFTTKEVGQGTGQGLAISRDIIVKKHGGTIFFETEAGVGTTFTVKLPINAMPMAKNAFPLNDHDEGVSGTEP